MARTDTHRPSAIIPENYQFVSFHYHSEYDFLANITNMEVFSAHMDRTGGKFAGHDHGGSCHICGAEALTTARFWHQPTNEYIICGETCADKLDFGNAMSFANFRKLAKAGIEAATGKAKAEKFLNDNALTHAWEIYSADKTMFEGGNSYGPDTGYDQQWEERTICDIVGKLVRYGSVSDKQTNFLQTLLTKIDTRDEREAAQAAEHDLADSVPITNDRIKIEGEILSVKVVDGYYKSQVKTVLKTLIRTEAGWKVWGTLPTAIDTAKRGNVVRLSAKVAVSKDDPKFGFFNRPSKAEIVSQREA
jgi:hypothetical protein